MNEDLNNISSEELQQRLNLPHERMRDWVKGLISTAEGVEIAVGLKADRALAFLDILQKVT